MNTSTLHLTTQNASRYLQQLGTHFGHKVPVTFTPSEGEVTLPFGTCEMAASGTALSITVHSPTGDIGSPRTLHRQPPCPLRLSRKPGPDLAARCLNPNQQEITMQPTQISRRHLLQGTTLTLGAAALLQHTLRPSVARAQTGDMPAGTIHSFSTGGVAFHTYVSPAQAVNVTAHIVEFDDQVLLVDATFIPPTAMEVAGAIASTGKPVGMAVLSHEHPDHWSAADIYDGVRFATLPAIREAVIAEASTGDGAAPANVADGPDLAIGTTEMSGVPVEFRHYENAEAPHHVVVVLPDQKVAIVQDLVYNGVFFAPGVDRANWIKILEDLRDDPACETLLVGHGLPTSRGDLDTAIAYIKVMDDAMSAAATPDEAVATIKAAFPGYGGEFLLSLIPEYWAK